MLAADFSGMNDLENRMQSMLERLVASERAQANANQVKAGNMSLADFDGWFAELVRVELGKQLAIVRNKAVQKAARAGSAATAVRRRMYKNELGGNINWASGGKRISSRRREYVPGKQRTVSKRTKDLNEYYGPDRAFILRFLDGGTDVRYAEGNGLKGRGSRASYGRRGAIAPRSFFHSMSSDMEAAAERMGTTLVGHVEKWIDNRINGK